MNSDALIGWIGQGVAKVEVVLSACTGALPLAKAVLLDGLEATTHHGAIDLPWQVAPRTTTRQDARFVDNGQAVLAAGIAAGIDATLHVVGRMLGQEYTVETARHVEYPWRPVSS
jgi:transcriptional regulator GlxA family with amidase domain